MKKAIVWTITLSVLLPFIKSPHLFSDFVAGKTVFVRGLAFAILAVFTYAVFFGKNYVFRRALFERVSAIVRNKLFLIIAVSILFTAVSTLFAYNKSFAFFGEISRTEGFLTIASFFVLFFAMIVAFEKKDWHRYFFATTIVGTITFIITLVQAINGGVRPDAWLGNPIFLATYFLFIITTGGYVFLEARKTGKTSGIFFGLFAIVTSIVGIFLTQSRGALLALLVAVTAGLIIVVIKNKGPIIWKKSARFWALTILVLTIASSGMFLSTRHADFWQKVPGLNRIATSDIAGGTIASRTKLTKLSINGFFQKSDAKTMLFGWGTDNYLFFFQENYDPSIYQFEQSVADRSHDKLVDVLIMAGIVGLILYLAIWFLLFKYCLHLMKERFSFGLVTFVFLVAFFVNNLFAFDVAVSYLAFYSITAFLVFSRYERV